MWYEILSKLIDTPPVRWFVERQRKAVEAIDPSRIYVENVRAFFGLPTPAARLLCETAVREGAFERHVGVLCPYDRHMLRSFKSEKDLPDTLECLPCEAEGRDEWVHPTEPLQRLTFYSLVDYTPAAHG